MWTVAVWLSLAAGFAWAVSWIAARLLVVEIRLRHADAVVVLAGAPVYFGRVAEAGRVFLAGRADRILLTDDGVRGSWSHTLQKNPLYYERAKLRLAAAGIPAASVELLPGRISSTFDEAELVRGYAATHGITSLIVVTSEYHTRRALWAVRRVLRGTNVQVGVEPATPLFAAVSPYAWWLSMLGWRSVCGEYAKLVYYWLRYR